MLRQLFPMGEAMTEQNHQEPIGAELVPASAEVAVENQQASALAPETAPIHETATPPVHTPVVAEVPASAVDAEAAPVPMTCLNCGAPVLGRYCVDCGQETDTRVPTLMEMVSDYLIGLFNLDSRIWRTLGVLLAKPGKLTQEYLAGRRARYTLPLRLYLATSLFMFLVAALPEPAGNDPDPDLDADVEATIEEGFPVTTDDNGNVFFTDEDGNRIPLEEATEDQCEFDVPFAPEGSELQTRVKLACLDNVEDNFTALKAAFADNFALMAFLIIPLMAAVFKLFYLFTGRGYLEHLTFLCHTHAFTFCLFALLDLFGDLGNFVPWLIWPVGIIGTALVLGYQPAYYFVAMRRVYGQGVLLTLVKYLLLFLVYTVVTISVFSMGLLILMFTT